MNKLISRNPVQRFKQGRKIVKAYDGAELNVPNPGLSIPSVNFGINPVDVINSVREKQYIPLGFINETKKRYLGTPKEYIPLGQIAETKKKYFSNTQSQKSKNSQNRVSFKDAFNKARQNGLQEFVWNGGRYTTQNEGEENFIFQNGKWVAPQPVVETPVVPQIQLPTAPPSIYNLMNPVEKDLKAPLSASVVPQTYNRTQVREFLRNKGVNPYSFSGDQRRALRMVLNGQGTNEDKALVQSMGIFSNKPKVVPQTISEQDLNTQKKVMDLTKNMVTDRKWWDASLSPTVDILNQLGQLKLASQNYKQGRNVTI